MLSIFGFNDNYTIQERMTRMALGIVWLFMLLLPLPVSIFNPIGWVGYCIYLIIMWFGLYPLRVKTVTEGYFFHWLFGGIMIVVALSIVMVPKICFPFLFVLLTLYLMYWQLEKRLYAIRRALSEYRFDDIRQEEAKEMVSLLVKGSLHKALPPAALGTLACAIGRIRWPIGAIIMIAVFVLLHFTINKKTCCF